MFIDLLEPMSTIWDMVETRLAWLEGLSVAVVPMCVTPAREEFWAS